MNRQKWEEAQTTKAVSFFKKLVLKLTTGKFRVIHWGWWPITRGKYGLSLYWTDKSEEE